MKVPFVVTLLVGVTGSACSMLPVSTNPSIETGIASLANSTKALQTVVDTESKAKPIVRRDEAIRYWILNGNDSAGTNLDSKKPKESFARFVCAGEGALIKSRSDLKYFSVYSSGLQAAVSPGADTFQGQFARFKDLSKKELALDLPEPPSSGKLFRDCFDETASLLDQYELGMPASDTSDEFTIAGAIALVEAGKDVIKSLQTLAKDGLKIVNEAKARAHLKQYIEANREGLAKVEAEINEKKLTRSCKVACSTLDDSWERRRAFVLGASYEKFKVILNDKDRRANSAKIRAAALDVSSELEAYDQITHTKRPSEVVKAWVSAAKQIDVAVNDDSVSVEAIIEYLQSVKEDFDTIEADYKASSDKFNAFVKSFHGG